MNLPSTTVKDWMPLADRILKQLYDNDQIQYSAEEMAEILQVSPSELIVAAHGIVSYDEYISEKKLNTTATGSLGFICKKGGKEGAVTALLSRGGFTAIYQDTQRELQRTEQQQKREVLLSELQISELLRLPEEARKTRQISRIAIAVALATLLFEIYKYFLT